MGCVSKSSPWLSWGQGIALSGERLGSMSLVLVVYRSPALSEPHLSRLRRKNKDLSLSQACLR